MQSSSFFDGFELLKKKKESVLSIQGVAKTSGISVLIGSKWLLFILFNMQ